MVSGATSEYLGSFVQVSSEKYLCRYFTNPDTPHVAYPEGFQGTSIPIDGAVVAKLCHERLQRLA